jgi:hypothetical protein
MSVTALPTLHFPRCHLRPARRRRSPAGFPLRDVTNETAVHRILAEVRPDILALNAGATPRMGRLDQPRWADFTATWETDVKAAPNAPRSSPLPKTNGVGTTLAARAFTRP